MGGQWARRAQRPTRPAVSAAIPELVACLTAAIAVRVRMEPKQQERVDPASETECEPSKRDTSVGYLENRDAVVTKKSPTSAELLKAGLKSSLSPSEATAQLRVLCRKFAALTDKVKEETKVREQAEREVRRLKAVLESNKLPAVASCRAETQAYVRELKEAQDKLKRDLRFEKDKNERVVAKALELEHEKSALLAAQSQQEVATRELDPSSQSCSSARQSAWDKEQVQKIQATLKLTIDELEEELVKKEEQVNMYRERFQRERARVKALEDDMRDKENAERVTQQARRQLEEDLRHAQTEITNELENVQRVHERAEEDRALRETLEEQLATLGEVNSALEQRSRALVRRLELAAGAAQEAQELKQQLHDVEVDNETLVQTIRSLKAEHFEREKEWKVRLEHAKEQKAQLEQQVAELQADLTSVQTQNSLFSEWMLVRNANALGSQREAPQHQRGPIPSTTEDEMKNRWHTHVEHEHDDSSSSRGFCNARHRHESPAIYPMDVETPRSQASRSSSVETRSVRTKRDTDNEYGETPRRTGYKANLYVRSEPNAKRYVSESASPQSQAPGSPTCTATSSHAWHQTPTSSPRRTGNQRVPTRSKQAPAYSPRGRRYRKNSTASISSSCSSTAPTNRVDVAPASSASSVRADHERLRKLMSRNRELQQRLQQETMGT